MLAPGLVLDSGGLSALATDRARPTALRNRGLWPAEVPAVVSAESLTGDHRRDFAVNRLLRVCQVRDVEEPCAREAARLRTAAGQADSISAVDAVVVAHAATRSDSVVITSDAGDLHALAIHAPAPIAILAT